MHRQSSLLPGRANAAESNRQVTRVFSLAQHRARRDGRHRSLSGEIAAIAEREQLGALRVANLVTWLLGVRGGALVWR